MGSAGELDLASVADGVDEVALVGGLLTGEPCVLDTGAAEGTGDAGAA